MKKIITKKSFWQSLLSTFIIALFAYIALASLGGISQQKYQLPDGRWEISKHYSDGNTETTTGNMDENGLWEGPVKVEYENDNYMLTHTEEVTMKAGQRHGTSTVTYPSGYVANYCYQHGERVNEKYCQQAENKSANDISANAIFTESYPWFAFKLEAFGFNPDYVKSYLDTVELLLYANEVPEDEFGDHYSDVLDVLEETPYDSLIQKNTEYTIVNGLDLILNHEFRLATLNSYMKGDSNTYKVMKAFHPNYLTELSVLEVSDAEFEEFCGVYDSIMSSYEPIPADDPNLMDSLDTRMFTTMDIISSGEEDAAAKSATFKGAISSINLRAIQNLSKRYFSEFKTQSLDNTPAEVAEIVLLTFLQKFVYGDLLQVAIQEAYAENTGIVRLATVTTNFEANTSGTSATLIGNVLEDGGGEITSRGIAWGTVYNPTLDNQVLNAGTGAGEFSVDLNGLSEGQTYFARAFAENSAGLAYGNCISMVAEDATGADAQFVSPFEFQVYPNPARDHLTLSFVAEDPEGIIFTLYDMDGKVAHQEELKNLVRGENIIQINLPEVSDGMYSSQIRGNEMEVAVQKLLIVR